MTNQKQPVNKFRVDVGIRMPSSCYDEDGNINQATLDAIEEMVRNAGFVFAGLNY